MVEDALDAKKVCDELRHQLALLKYNPDLLKMLKNIESMVTELSKKEVEARQLKRVKIIEKPLEDINQSIVHLEQLILMAKIMD